MPNTHEPEHTSGNTEFLEDLISDSGISQVWFQDSSLPDFDAASAVREAAEPAEKPQEQSAAVKRKKFGKRSQRFLPDDDTAPAESLSFSGSQASAKPASPVSPAPNPAAAAASSAAARSSAASPAAGPAAAPASKPAGVIPAREILENQPDEPEKAAFVKPIAANIVARTSSKNVQVSDVNAEEERLFSEFKDPLEDVVQENRLDEDEIIDPKASLVDDYDYDLYEDKKRFFLSDYPRIEEYLARQSKQGYHYVRHEGKHYYFHHGFPRDYYYEILYFAQEPAESQFDLWKEDGWDLISRQPAKKKNEAGWFVMRNEFKPGGFRKEIINEQEKYRFFRSYSNSCRSTMFMLFICMVVCALMGFMQYYFHGYLWSIILCGVIFAAALWCFLIYGRMLRKSNKQIRLLKAKLRLQNSEHNVDIDTLEENQHELDEDWNSMDHDLDDDPSDHS